MTGTEIAGVVALVAILAAGLLAVTFAAIGLAVYVAWRNERRLTDMLDRLMAGDWLNYVAERHNVPHYIQRREPSRRRQRKRREQTAAEAPDEMGPFISDGPDDMAPEPVEEVALVGR